MGVQPVVQAPLRTEVGAVLCCAVLCCAVLCCAVLCCAVLCCAVLAVLVGRSKGAFGKGEGCSCCCRQPSFAPPWTLEFNSSTPLPLPPPFPTQFESPQNDSWAIWT